MVIHTKKQVKTKTIHKRMNLPQSLRDKIDEFWKKQVKVNPNLFNGEVWNVTKMEENKDNILLTIEKTDYAHYLYDERHGIEEKYACHNLAGGTYIVTKDGYAVVGELDDTTSYPRMMQVSGGGIDEKYDIVNGEFDLIKTAKRELKEELGLIVNRDEIKYIGDIFLGIPIADVYYLEKDITLKDLKLQKEEVDEVSYMTKDEILNLINNENFTKSHGKILKKYF